MTREPLHCDACGKEERDDDALPPCHKYDCLETQELGQGVDFVELVLRCVVELDEAVEGPHLTEVLNDRYVWVPAVKEENSKTTGRTTERGPERKKSLTPWKNQTPLLRISGRNSR